MRRHSMPEPEAETDASAAELQRTLQLLLPIRRQRLSRSERQQREQEQALRAVVDKTVHTERKLDEKKGEYQQIRAGFMQQNAGVQQAKFRLERALQSEQQAAEEVDRQRLSLHELAEQQQQQQQRVEQAQRETRLRLRDVEKLEYLLQQNEVLG